MSCYKINTIFNSASDLTSTDERRLRLFRSMDMIYGLRSLLTVLRTATELGKRSSYHVAAPVIWNSLDRPEHLR